MGSKLASESRAASGRKAAEQVGAYSSVGTAGPRVAPPVGYDDGDEGGERLERRQLWVEEAATRRRLPDPVRTAAVRAMLIVSLTLIQAMTAFFCAMAESWLAFPMVLSSVASTIVATWSVCDVWVTRQVWNQRNGVVSMPSSSARQLRRERRRARRDARATARSQEDIRSRGGARGQLSHS
ncbi:hypothetical protein [Streptomyces aureocirculatus]|uniref:hypothetical protein n=1 Tax=Streptomyces aureocirculatus TaxID=67275 RepID=UPI00055CD7AF|nr:hypothetical protein [Streptomyces aureocirculatus]